MKKLVSEVNETGQISETTQTSFEKAKDRYQELTLRDDDPAKKKLLQTCQKEVEQENPVRTFWNPQASEVEMESKHQDSKDSLEGK